MGRCALAMGYSIYTATPVIAFFGSIPAMVEVFGLSSWFSHSANAALATSTCNSCTIATAASASANESAGN